MSNPSFSNIDQWLFELYEGNLSPEQIAQLETFLMQHPELDVDLDMWKLSYVSATPLVYPHQDKLEKRRPAIIYWSAGTAAIFALIVGGIFYFEADTTPMLSLSSTPLANRDLSTNIDLLNEKTVVYTDNSSINSRLEQNASQQYVSENNVNGNNSQILTSSNRALTNDSYLTEASLNSHLTHSLAYSENSSSRSTAVGQMKMKRFHFDEQPYSHLAFRMKNNPSAEIEEIEDWTLRRKSAKHKSQSFSYKLNDFKRAIQKMADNPIALKNLKDPHYHVPGMQAVDINFGAVGTLLATRVQTNTRYQWMGQSNDQLSNNLLIDGYVYAIRGGIGLQVNQSTYHKNGYQNTFAAVTYSPKFSVNKNVTVEPAIRFKMGNQRINPSKLSLGQLVEFDRGNAQQFYSEDEVPTGKAMWYKDLGLSVMVNTKWFYAGAQFDNLGRHQSNIYGSEGKQRAGIHSVFTLGTDYESQNKKLGFSPYFVYQNFEKLSEAWLGANFRASWFTVGAAVSSNAEPAASIGVKFKHFAMTYNADYTKSMITSNYALSHQLTLRFLTNPSRVGQRLLNY